jgi:hypothetical protein
MNSTRPHNRQHHGPNGEQNHRSDINPVGPRLPLRLFHMFAQQFIITPVRLKRHIEEVADDRRRARYCLNPHIQHHPPQGGP